MAKPKAKTLIARQGFKDPDFLTPEHDAVIDYLYQNLGPLVETAIGKSWDREDVNTIEAQAQGQINILSKDLHARQEQLNKDLQYTQRKLVNTSEKDNTTNPHFGWQENSRQSLEADIARIEEELGELEYHKCRLDSWKGLGEPPDRPEYKIQAVDEEHIVSTGSNNQYVVGAIDLQIVVDTHFIHYIGGERLREELPSWSLFDRRAVINVEVKTSIPSVGDLIRQIKFYQNYDGYQKPIYVVASPDKRASFRLQSQGILFFHCPPQSLVYEAPMALPMQQQALELEPAPILQEKASDNQV